MNITPLHDLHATQQGRIERQVTSGSVSADERGETQLANLQGTGSINEPIANGSNSNGQHLTARNESQPTGSYAMANPMQSTSSDTIAVSGPQNGQRVNDPTSATMAPPASTSTPMEPLGPPPKRPIGRPRGSKTRGVTKPRATGKPAKRKRRSGSAAADDDGSSSDSEVATPTTTLTKSGRQISKPTTYIPPPAPFPTTQPGYKRRKPATRKNPDAAVCKLCLRGVSPAGNMIVFCDGCNTPWHRWCHKPPIAAEVIEEVEREWFCGACVRERGRVVEMGSVEGFVSCAGLGQLERQRYFASLPPGLLVTLLTRATTLHPDLPVFEPDFVAKTVPPPTAQLHASNSHAHPPVSSYPSATLPHPPIPPAIPPPATAPEQTTMIIHDMNDDDDDDGYGSDTHPSHYPRPGQGFMSTLPPESEDLHFLVDDENSKGVFTHLYQAGSEAATGAGAQR